MASIIRLDQLQSLNGNVQLNNGYPRRPGRIIEYLTSHCDGSTMTGESGTYTTQIVTAQQNTTNTFTDVLGSSIDYLPPAATTEVIYRYTFSSHWAGIGSHSIQHFRFRIAGTEVVQARFNRSSIYYENRSTFEWAIPIGGVADNNTGRQATWTTPKTLKLETRSLASGSNIQHLNGTYYWDGTTGNFFSVPQITIIAIA